MNWNARSISEVNKERIWREIVASEQRDIKIFDRFRSSPGALRRCPSVSAPISERSDRFLDKKEVLFQSVCQRALPEVRSNAQSGHPFTVIRARTSVSSGSPVFTESTDSRTSSAASTRQRPTSSAEYGSSLQPLVKHRFNPFYYTVPKSDLRVSLQSRKA